MGLGGNDALIGGMGEEEFMGGEGADIVISGGGEDRVMFEQGDSTEFNFYDENNSEMLDNGDIFEFWDGVDVVSGLQIGSKIQFGTPDDTVNSLTLGALSSGEVGDQQYSFVRGTYDEVSGSFTVNTTLGADSLVVYDGDGSSWEGMGYISQTAFVVRGLTPASFKSDYSRIEIVDGVAPKLNGGIASFDANTVSLRFNEAMQLPTDFTGLTITRYAAGQSLTESGTVVGVSSVSMTTTTVANDTIVLTTSEDILLTDILRVSYSGNDAIKDMAENETGFREAFIGVSGDNVIDLSDFHADSENWLRIFGNDGIDTITGTNGNEVIYGGGGQDVIDSNWGTDDVVLNETTAARDTVILNEKVLNPRRWTASSSLIRWAMQLATCSTCRQIPSRKQ